MRRQRLVLASSAAVAIILVAAVLVMVNWISYRHFVRADWTRSQLYSLSDKSRNIVKGLTSDVRIVVLMTPTTPLFAEVKELLNRYQAVSPRVKVEFIDPERDPMRTRQLAQEFGVSSANTVVFAAGERKKYVTSDQLADYDYSGMQMGQGPKMTGFKGEEQFTAAILGVVNPKVPKVYFVGGHGEHDVDGMDRDGYGQIKEALKRENLEVLKASLLSGPVPADCDLLVIAGPTATFSDTEVSLVKMYLDGGGRALVMLDPVLGNRTRPAGLDALLKGYGVQVNNDLVVDPARKLPFFDLSAVYATDFRSHPVVAGMQGLAVLLPVTRSVATVTAPGATSTTLITTSADGWGETNLELLIKKGQAAKDDKDTPGPVPLAVAAEAEKGKDKAWRLVVIGNSAFAANAYVANAGNPNLMLNAVNWLIRREQAIGIAPRAPEQVQLFLSAQAMRNIFLISLIGLPALAIVLGVTVWWRRRH